MIAGSHKRAQALPPGEPTHLGVCATELGTSESVLLQSPPQLRQESVTESRPLQCLLWFRPELMNFPGEPYRCLAVSVRAQDPVDRFLEARPRVGLKARYCFLQRTGEHLIAHVVQPEALPIFRGKQRDSGLPQDPRLDGRCTEAVNHGVGGSETRNDVFCMIQNADVGVLKPALQVVGYVPRVLLDEEHTLRSEIPFYQPVQYRLV